MPVATCADGTSLERLLREKGELARWYAQVAGAPFAPPDVPRSLLPARTRTPSPFGSREGDRLAANADRELVEEERSRDLNDVFAGRLAEAIRLYAEAVTQAREGPPGPDLRTSLTASAREEAPALIGFARLADRRTVRLDPPAEAAPTARLVADGFVTLAAAERRGRRTGRTIAPQLARAPRDGLAAASWPAAAPLLVLRPALAYSRSQNPSSWLAEGRLRLIWRSRTPDTLATLAMCPVVALAPAPRVPACRGFLATCGSFDLRCVSRSQNPSFASRRVVSA
jgi:hypothetical protein